MQGEALIMEVESLSYETMSDNLPALIDSLIKTKECYDL